MGDEATAATTAPAAPAVEAAAPAASSAPATPEASAPAVVAAPAAPAPFAWDAWDGDDAKVPEPLREPVSKAASYFRPKLEAATAETAAWQAKHEAWLGLLGEDGEPDKAKVRELEAEIERFRKDHPTVVAERDRYKTEAETLRSQQAEYEAFVDKQLDEESREWARDFEAKNRDLLAEPKVRSVFNAMISPMGEAGKEKPGIHPQIAADAIRLGADGLDRFLTLRDEFDDKAALRIARAELNIPAPSGSAGLVNGASPTRRPATRTDAPEGPKTAEDLIAHSVAKAAAVAKAAGETWETN